MATSTTTILPIPESIKAIGFESPDSEFKVVTLPPINLGPRDILVQIEAVAVNPVDNKKSKSSATPSNPVVLGFDASGIVVKIGS